MIILDDHLVRDFVADELPPPIAEKEELGTTNLWLFRLVAALANQGFVGSLSRPILGLEPEDLERYRSALAERVASLTVVPLEILVWDMAALQQRHRAERRGLSTLSAEALAAARHLGAGIAVADGDVGPALRDAAEADDIPFSVIAR